MSGSSMSVPANLICRITLGDCLRRSARRYPKKVALVDGEKRITYEELNRQANQFGHALLNLGLNKADKVVYIGTNRSELLIVFFGAAKAGMVFVPINPAMKPAELKYAIDHVDAKAVVVDEKFVSALNRLKPDLKKVDHFIAVSGSPNKDIEMHSFAALLNENAAEEVEVLIADRDPVQILFTGGTTAFPRAAVLTHLSVIMSCCSTALDFKGGYNDILLVALPLFHVALLNGATRIIMLGGTNVILERVDITEILKVIDREKVTTLVLLSPMYRAMLDHPDFQKFDLSSLKNCFYFGAVMPKSFLKECREKICPNFVSEFGQTEMSPCATTFKPQDQIRKRGSLGNSGVFVEIGVMDEEGNLLPPGQLGEFVYRSPHVMEGYYQDAESNEAAFRYGWFHSGDLGYLDEDGYVYFVDRKKDMIKTGGENVASIEVEKVIYQDERVQEVHVIGLPHERWVEAITAVVLPRPAAVITKEEIISHCKRHLADYKVPKSAIFVENFPRSSTGKALKYQLRKQFQDYYLKDD